MSEIDWSKAPAGATHWQPKTDEFAESWIKVDREGVAFFVDGLGWRRNAGLDGKAIPRPTQWRGPADGLPPVGTVCEADADTRAGDYEPCLVVWHDPNADDDDHPVLALFKSRHVNKFVEPEWCSDFRALRPLKSDKERAVEAAMGKIDKITTMEWKCRRQFLEQCYDAGLLRLPEEQS